MITEKNDMENMITGKILKKLEQKNQNRKAMIQKKMITKNENGKNYNGTIMITLKY